MTTAPAPDLTRFSFCPKGHFHATAQDAANCTYLLAAFGPIRKASVHKPVSLCSVPGCTKDRRRGCYRCRDHENERRRQLRASQRQTGRW